MKKYKFFIFILFVVFSFSQDSTHTIKIPSDTAISYKDTLILFSNFENYNVDSTMVEKLSKQFYNTLNSFKGYKVVPNSVLDSILSKNNISIDSCNYECFVNAAKELNVKYIVQCRIGKTETDITNYTLNTDLIRADDGIIISSSTYKVENELNDFFDGIKTILIEILKKEKSTISIRNKAKNVYSVSFDRIFIDDLDFQRSIFNNPQPISIFFFENNILIMELFIGQKRNEFNFQERDNIEIKRFPHYKKIKYSPNSNYMIIIKEDGFLKNISKYEIKFPTGEWPFDKNKIYFTNNTYLEVSQDPSFPDNKKYPIHKYLHRFQKSYCLSLKSDLMEPWKFKGVEFYAFNRSAEWNSPVYKYLHKSDSVFLYSIDTVDTDVWEKKETAFYALNDSLSGSIPIYRFYHKIDNDYYYTSKKSLGEGWDNIRLEFYAFPNI